MIFDPATGSLYNSSGKLLKVLHCPHNMTWNQLLRTDDADRRSCSKCPEDIIDLENKSDDEVTALLVRSPYQCVRLRLDWPNVTVLQSNVIAQSEIADSEGVADPPAADVVEDALDPEPRGPDHKLVIRTARTEEAMNAAARRGYWPVLEKVPTASDSPCSESAVVVQNPTTGEVAICSDPRRLYRNDLEHWNTVFSWFSYYQYARSEPVAAYLVPRNLAPDSQVILEDPIIDIIGSTHTGSYRATNVAAVWTGTGFRILWDESDVVDYIG